MPRVASPSESVAVVIPTRDRHALAARAVRSALAQTLPPAEVVVVDDGSDPPVRLPPDLSGDARVTVVRLETSGGSHAARNVGIARTSSALVAFLDDDDEWFPPKLERQVAALRSLPIEVAGVDCGYDLCDAGRRPVRTVPPADRDLPRILLERPALLPSALLLRRAALEEVGVFNTELHRTEDWELALRLVDRFEVATVPEVLLRWNRSTTSPQVLLESYRRMVERSLAPRLAAVADPAERARLDAWHQMVVGVYLARCGRSGEARRTLWRAWRASPRQVRPLFQIGRTVVGERAWETVRRAVRRR